MRPRHWLSRLTVTCWAGHIPLVTWLEPESLSARAIQQSGPIARFFMLVLAVAAVLALVDSVMNDALLAGYSPRLRDHRHVGFMVMCISLFMLAAILTARAGPSGLLLSYFLPGIFAAIVVWPDMLSRHQRAPA